jgi:hypothetical protein
MLPDLKRRYPSKSEDDLKQMAYGLCQDQYNKRKKKESDGLMGDLSLRWNGKMQVFETLSEAMHGIRSNDGCEITLLDIVPQILESENPTSSPTSATDSVTIAHESSTDITITADETTTTTVTESVPEETPHIFIRGTAIGEGVTRNLNEYLAPELQRAAPTLADVPLQLDHGRTVSDNAGRVLVASFDPRTKSIDYVARLRRSKTEAFEAVRLGDVNSVSIGANIDDVKCNICNESKLNGNCSHVVGQEYEGEIATRIGVGLEFFELSITPFGAYQGADIAGVVSNHSITLDDAIATFTESWQKKFGEQTNMSEPNTDQAAETKLTEVQKELTSEKQSKQLLTERLNKTLARSIVDAEIEMGDVKPEDSTTKIESLRLKTTEALELLSENMAERLTIFRHDNIQADSPRSMGIVSEDEDDPDPTMISVEDAKKFLCVEWMGWPEPSETAKAKVRAMRKNSYHPNHALYRSRALGGN